MKSRLAVILAAALGIAGVFAQEKPDPRVQALKRLHPLLKEYHAAMETLPPNIMDLYREAFADDPLLFFLKGSPEHELAKQFSERATPSFDVLTKKWEGDIVSCGPFGEGWMYYLRADGAVREGQVDLLKHYGRWNHTPLSPYAMVVPAELLKKPTAKLGVVLREIETDEGTAAVVVDRIIPGYGSSRKPLFAGHTLLQTGDRLISVGGHRVKDLAGLEKAMPYLKVRPGFSVVLLRGKLWEAKALAPLITLDVSSGMHGNAAWVAKRAAAYLHPRGPGRIGIATRDHPKGQEIIKIMEKSAAERAGLKVGDVVAAVEANPVRDARHLVGLVRTYPAGTTVRIGLQRGGMQKTQDVKLGEIDPVSLSSARFKIHAGLLDVRGAMGHARGALTFDSVVEFVEWNRSQDAALEWISGAIKQPSPMLYNLTWSAYWARSRLLERMGRWKEAIEDLDRVHKAHGKMPPLYREKADIYWRRKEYDQAIELYRKGLATAAWGKEGHTMDLGRKLARIGRKDEARKIFQGLVAHPFWGKEAKKNLAELDRE
ncbi:MAG: PDZ domain-containing protein [Victivallales bacterium]|nr:PDZ domain-containing protein [Victivallales bacterium]